MLGHLCLFREKVKSFQSQGPTCVGVASYPNSKLLLVSVAFYGAVVKVLIRVLEDSADLMMQFLHSRNRLIRTRVSSEI